MHFKVGYVVKFTGEEKHSLGGSKDMVNRQVWVSANKMLL